MSGQYVKATLTFVTYLPEGVTLDDYRHLLAELQQRTAEDVASEELLSFLGPQELDLGLSEDPEWRRVVGQLRAIDVRPARLDFVYFIQAETSALVKIGRTQDPSKRFGQLSKNALPHDSLSPLGYFRTDCSKSAEAWFHAYFKSRRIQGEWFRISRDEIRFDIAAFIDAGGAVYRK